DPLLQRRELATLQQWIISSVVTRESLISRTGKTWKRLGDIPELGQYFVIAEEARAQRSHKPTGKPAAPSTMLGVGTAADDDMDGRTTGNFRARPKTPPPPPPRSTRAPTPPPPPPAAAAPTPAPA